MLNLYFFRSRWTNLDLEVDFLSRRVELLSSRVELVGRCGVSEDVVGGVIFNRFRRISSSMSSKGSESASMLSESEFVTASMPSRIMRLLEDCELIGRLERDEEDTDGSMAGCFLGTVGGGEGGLGLDSGEVRGLSSRGTREIGAWYGGGLEGIGVGMRLSMLVSLEGRTRVLLRRFEETDLWGGMEKRDFALCCCWCCCCTLVAAAVAF